MKIFFYPPNLYFPYILYLIKKGINNINANKINIIYPLILLTLISLIHNNWVLFPPIYLVAFASISAIRNNDKITINDKLIFLGDYVDGWSESAATIQFLIEIAEKHDCILIKGNHDAWCENYLRANESLNEWLR